MAKLDKGKKWSQARQKKRGSKRGRNKEKIRFLMLRLLLVVSFSFPRSPSLSSTPLHHPRRKKNIKLFREQKFLQQLSPLHIHTDTCEGGTAKAALRQQNIPRPRNVWREKRIDSKLMILMIPKRFSLCFVTYLRAHIHTQGLPAHESHEKIAFDSKDPFLMMMEAMAKEEGKNYWKKKKIL